MRIPNKNPLFLLKGGRTKVRSWEGTGEQCGCPWLACGGYLVQSRCVGRRLAKRYKIVSLPLILLDSFLKTLCLYTYV